MDEMEFTEAESNMNDLVSSFSFFIRILYFTFMYVFNSTMLSWMFENKVSEYQQYQDALAEDEFFDEDQVSCL